MVALLSSLCRSLTLPRGTTGLSQYVNRNGGISWSYLLSGLKTLAITSPS